MSSFDASDTSHRGTHRRAGSGGFEPLCPAGEEEKPPNENWRPLLGDADFDETFGADGPNLTGGREGPQGQDESDVQAAEARSEESTQAFAEGYDLGRQETQANLQNVAESLVKSVEQLGSFRAQLRQRYERELLELALGVARKILHAELSEKPETWLEVIRKGLRGAVDREEVRIRVPAPLAAFFTEHLPVMRSRLDEVKELVIVDDPGLQEGGCVIETRFGELDLGIDTQVDQIDRELTRVG